MNSEFRRIVFGLVLVSALSVGDASGGGLAGMPHSIATPVLPPEFAVKKDCGEEKSAAKCFKCCASKANRVYVACMKELTEDDNMQNWWQSPYHEYCKSESALFQSWCMATCPPPIVIKPK